MVTMSYDLVVRVRGASPEDPTLPPTPEEFAAIAKSYAKIHAGDFGTVVDPEERDQAREDNPSGVEWSREPAS